MAKPLTVPEQLDEAWVAASLAEIPPRLRQLARKLLSRKAQAARSRGRPAWSTAALIAMGHEYQALTAGGMTRTQALTFLASHYKRSSATISTLITRANSLEKKRR